MRPARSEGFPASQTFPMLPLYAVAYSVDRGGLDDIWFKRNISGNLLANAVLICTVRTGDVGSSERRFSSYSSLLQHGLTC